MLKKINLTDYIILIFIILSGILIIFERGKTEHFLMLISARIIALLIIFILLKFNTNSNNKTLTFLRHFYPLVFTAYFYGETGYYNNIFFSDLDLFFVQAEEFLFGFQPSIRFSSEYNNVWLSELMYFSYFSYYLIMIIFPIIIYLKNRNEFERIFFIIIFSFYTYYLIFAVFPVIGPQFYFPSEHVEIANPLIWSSIIKFIQDIGETPTGAFPSSHVGISWIILLISAKTNQKLLIILFPLVLLICFSTVYIKAHYVIDVLGGIISALLFYFLGNKIYTFYTKKYDTNLLNKFSKN